MALQMDAAVAGMNAEQRASAVHRSPQTGATQASLHGDGNVGVDVSIAGVHVHVSREIGGNRSAHAAVVGVDLPGTCQLRTGVDIEFNVPVTRREIEAIEAALGANVAVAGMRPQ